MAFLPLASLPLPCTVPSKMLPLQLHTTKATSSIQCNASNNSIAITRRSAHFKPTVWHHDYIQSLRSKYIEESYANHSRALREEVRMMLNNVVDDPLQQLELIDVLQRLGVAYHFDNDIKNILENHFNSTDKFKGGKNLYATALEFRLLRQHGYNLSPTEVFDSFRDEMGNFKELLSVDIQGMLSLYEASFHSVVDETILEKARDFTSEFLKEYVNVRKNKDNHMSLLINHALELPLHWRMPRWEALWFINAYERSPIMIPALLQFAKLNFNMVQAIHLEELKHTSRWWQGIGITGKLSFFRDRLVEGFFWSQGFNCKPNDGYFRRIMTKIITFTALIDDMYDVYGTLEELELFTEAVDRWDINSVDNLPDYMKISFLGLFNFVNELAFDILKAKEHDILPYLKKSWTDLCKAYLIEARWYYSGYVPSLQEYMENAWISVTAPVILVHSYFLIPDPIRKEDLNLLKEYPNLLRFSATIFRLADDLGSHKREKETGDVPKSIECYMNEYKTSEADAHAHVKSMISTTWKKMNEEASNFCFSPNYRDVCVNVARTALWCYQHGDAYSDQDPKTNNSISSILFKAIPAICAENNLECDISS